MHVSNQTLRAGETVYINPTPASFTREANRGLISIRVIESGDLVEQMQGLKCTWTDMGKHLCNDKDQFSRLCAAYASDTNSLAFKERTLKLWTKNSESGYVNIGALAEFCHDKNKGNSMETHAKLMRTYQLREDDDIEGYDREGNPEYFVSRCSAIIKFPPATASDLESIEDVDTMKQMVIELGSENAKLRLANQQLSQQTVTLGSHSEQQGDGIKGPVTVDFEELVQLLQPAARRIKSTLYSLRDKDWRINERFKDIYKNHFGKPECESLMIREALKQWLDYSKSNGDSEVNLSDLIAACADPRGGDNKKLAGVIAKKYGVELSYPEGAVLSCKPCMVKIALPSAMESRIPENNVETMDDDVVLMGETKLVSVVVESSSVESKSYDEVSIDKVSKLVRVPVEGRPRKRDLQLQQSMGESSLNPTVFERQEGIIEGSDSTDTPLPCKRRKINNLN